MYAQTYTLVLVEDLTSSSTMLASNRRLSHDVVFKQNLQALLPLARFEIEIHGPDGIFETRGLRV